jgi:cell division protein FtsA
MIVDVRIDGYRVRNPLNFQGGDVSMSVFNAYAPTVHLGALRTIAAELGLDLLNIAAEPYAVARSVDVDDLMDFSAIFIDIGGGTTDIAVVRHGGLEGTKMFALGGRAFTKRLAEELKVSFDEAEQIKLDYAWGKFSPTDTAKMSEFFTDDCRVWLSGVELSLAEFSANDLLPNRIFLCGGGSGLPGIKAALQSVEWTTHLPFAKPPQVGFLQPKDITRVADMTNTLINPQDITPMGLANLILQFTNEEKLLASILRRTVETIQRD